MSDAVFEPDPRLLAAAGEAVPGDAPAGINARYETEYEALETEIGKLEAINGQPVDWRRVVELGLTVLRDKSKDLNAACFVARGLVDQRGFAGLADGLTLVHTLASTYWEEMFPPAKRARARGAALEWLNDRLKPWVEKAEPGERDAAAVVHAAETMSALEALAEEKLGERAPAFGELRRLLTGMAEEARRTLDAQAEARAAEEAPAPEEAKPAPAAETPPSAAPQPQASQPEKAAPAKPAPTQAQEAAPAPAVELPAEPTADVTKSLRAIQGALRPLAEHLRQQSLGDPRAYRLLRTAVWLPMAQLPPHDGGQTQVPPVDPGVIQSLETMAANGSHAEVVARAEDAFVAAPFWLDCHRFTAAALDALGHVPARQAVVASLRHFLDLMPDLPGLRLAGGQPVADDQTRTWLDAEVLGGPAADSSGTGAGPAEPWTQALQEARQVSRERGFEAGLAVFRDGIRQADGLRNRFLWSINQAKYCMGSSRPDVALPQLQELDDIAVAFGLDRWEPELMIELAKNLLLCYRNAKVDANIQADRDRRMPRLAKFVATFDAVSAADLLKQ